MPALTVLAATLAPVQQTSVPARSYPHRADMDVFQHRHIDCKSSSICDLSGWSRMSIDGQGQWMSGRDKLELIELTTQSYPDDQFDHPAPFCDIFALMTKHAAGILHADTKRPIGNHFPGTARI